MAGIGATGDLARVNTNIGSMNTYNHLRKKNANISSAQEHLATGKTINRASDSPANYVIVRKMTAKQNALKTAQESIGSGISALQEADSALAQMHDILLEMKVLSQQAQSDTIGHTEREAIQYEIRQYADEINDIASDTNWQGVSLLDGTMNWTLQVGEKSSDTIQVALSSSEGKGFDIASLGLENLTVTDAKSAAESWSKLNDAENMVLGTEERIGAIINRMTLKSEALSSAETNTAAAISRIQDTDIALKQMELAKENILQQIAIAMLSQTQNAPGNFLSLFK